MRLSSWSCKGCTNLCNRVYGGETSTYCKPILEGRHRTEWQGDHVACLDFTEDPAAYDDVVRMHECYLTAKGEEHETTTD